MHVNLVGRANTGRCAHTVTGVGVGVGGKVVGRQVAGGFGISGVARGDRRGGDDLGIGVDRHVPLVAVEPAGGTLVHMPRVWIDGGDHPILGQ
jgi:hypothetical protein